MSNALNRVSLQLKSSVNTPDFPADEWVINPDMSAVEGVDNKYWKLNGDIVSEMNPAEKDAVDLAASETAKDATIAEMQTGALGVLIDVFVDSGNETRAASGLPLITAINVRDAARGKL